MAPRRSIGPRITGYTLLTKADEGGYGEVYLAKTIMGHIRAVKVVYQDRMGSSEAFDREFRGVKAYERVSRKHPGLIDILHVGRSNRQGFFYYVMDPADDTRSGATPDPADYEPRTLRSYLGNWRALPVDECIRIGIELASALEFLQQNGLVHRDIKLDNIVFVGGKLKLADIGLVAESGEARSIVGTEGYVPPENHGTFAGDVYSLGKLLYEITTGRDRMNINAAASAEADTKDARYAGLSRIIDKACAEHYSDRYQSAKALRKALEELAGDGSAHGAKKDTEPLDPSNLRIEPPPSSGLMRSILAGIAIAFVVGGLIILKQDVVITQTGAILTTGKVFCSKMSHNVSLEKALLASAKSNKKITAVAVVTISALALALSAEELQKTWDESATLVKAEQSGQDANPIMQDRRKALFWAVFCGVIGMIGISVFIGLRDKGTHASSEARMAGSGVSDEQDRTTKVD